MIRSPIIYMAYMYVKYTSTFSRGGVMIEFSELRGPNKIFGSFCKINEPNILL